MLKNIKNYSIIALTALVIIGCGGGSGSKSGGEAGLSKLTYNGKAATINGLRSLGNSANTDNLSNSKIRSSASSLAPAKSGESQNEICQSGTMDFDNSNDEKIISFDANNCNDGYSTIDGSARVEITSDKSGFAEVLADLTVKDEYFSLFAKKGSKIELSIDASNMSLTTSFQMKINGEEFSASNFAVVGSGDDNGGSFYIKSGEMVVGDYYFKVDPSHDGSTTPIIIGDNGFVSGAIKLLDGAGHKMEISVASKDELALKIDENGDGVFTANEILVENIKDELDLVDSK